MRETGAETLRQAERVEAKSQPLVEVCKRFAVPLIILLHLALTLTLSYKLNIWVDEAFSLHTTGRSIASTLRQALNFELQAPLYFVLLSLWRKLNGSIFFARLFSVACVALTIKTVAVLSTRFWKDAHPGWIAATIAFNPVSIAVAVDIRLYALVLLLSALLLLAFYDGYLAPVASRRAQVCYVVLSVAALYTQYYTGFLLAANACALLVLKRWRPLLEYVVGMVVVGLCFSPMLPFIRYQMSAHTSPMQNTETWFEGLKFVTWRMKDYLLAPGYDPLLAVRSWLLRACYLAALFVIIRNRRRLTQETIALWTITLSIALFFLITARLSGEMLLQIRHTVVLFLPVTFAAYSIVILSGKRKALLIWTLILLVFSVASLVVKYRPLSKDGDWQRVAAHLMAAEKAGQPILVFHAGGALPLSWYYTGRNALVPIPRENTFDRFDFHDYVLRDEREILAALERAPGDEEQVWLVTDGNCGFADLSYNCPLLEEFVGRHYTVEEIKYFNGSMVRFLRRKASS